MGDSSCNTVRMLGALLADAAVVNAVLHRHVSINHDTEPKIRFPMLGGREVRHCQRLLETRENEAFLEDGQPKHLTGQMRENHVGASVRLVNCTTFCSVWSRGSGAP